MGGRGSYAQLLHQHAQRHLPQLGQLPQGGSSIRIQTLRLIAERNDFLLFIRRPLAFFPPRDQLCIAVA
jgi:hypothetical protein